MTDSLDETPNDSPPASRKPRRWWWLLAIVPVFLLLDALHAAYVAASIDAWAAKTDLNADGVIAGCEAYELSPEDPTATGTAILFVHGFNASPRHWDLVAPALAERGYHCRAMRLPGFAEPLTLGRDRSYREWIDAVTTELGGLRSAYERVGVVGHSLGGAVTLGALLDDSEAADFAVLVAPAIAVSDSRAPLFSTRTWHEVSQRLFVFTRILRTPFPMDVRAEGKTDHVGRMPFSSKRIADELFKLMDRNAVGAAELTTPTTMFVCAGDPIVDSPAAEAYFQAIGAADKELIVLEKSGHEAPLDQEWERVVEAIAARAKP